MIWIITAATAVKEEGTIITHLLEAGADRVLLRKPGWDASQYSQLVTQISPAFYHRLIIRDQVDVCHQYGLAGIHWSGAARQQVTPAQVSPQLQHSTGIHDTADIPLLGPHFSTLLLSPVFNSISKPDYKGQHAQTLTNKGPHQVLALGGVDAHNIRQIKQWQFDGAAILGAIWQEPAQAVEHYYRIQELWNKSDLM
ncbi:thiamine phosphate synthase [Chitinophaga nivalis]|uniref:Thiamine phosphate synthase n=1 Tax=Chitinophaga nivalis TaxID=2991709 RepID=A0ABT3IUW4_9BACT|nr:thiamine phosphate synthase [Chitinophaga nivalis]MCW3462532.1 thiamine phosphate synthase [Chitinophaga nivalis]MCW3487777.1 thiamine phosphate synthase [Chitinophaga nivalis]